MMTPLYSLSDPGLDPGESKGFDGVYPEQSRGAQPITWCMCTGGDR
jgi:hypothetical protein